MFFVCNSENEDARTSSLSHQLILIYIRTAEVKERPGYEVRNEFKYHGGLAKEECIRFGSKTGLDNARTRCKYDGNIRLALVETELNGRELPSRAFSYNQNLGLLEGVNRESATIETLDWKGYDKNICIYV